MGESNWVYGDAVPGIRDSLGRCKVCNTHNEVHAPNCANHPDRVLINRLRAENERIVAESEQCHARNDELVTERFDLRRQLATAIKERDRAREELSDMENKRAKEYRRAEKAEAALEQARIEEKKHAKS